MRCLTWRLIEFLQSTVKNMNHTFEKAGKRHTYDQIARRMKVIDTCSRTSLWLWSAVCILPTHMAKFQGKRRGGVTPRDRCVGCLPVIRCCCHVICLRVASCHVMMCIASSCFSKLALVRVSQFCPLCVLCPDTLARARGMSEIVFYKWPENVLGMG